MSQPENIKQNPVVKYFAEAKSELQKVTWPTRETIVNHTLMVIGLCLVLAVFIGIVDYILNLGIQLIVK